MAAPLADDQMQPTLDADVLPVAWVGGEQELSVRNGRAGGVRIPSKHLLDVLCEVDDLHCVTLATMGPHDENPLLQEVAEAG